MSSMQGVSHSHSHKSEVSQLAGIRRASACEISVDIRGIEDEATSSR